MIPFIKTFDFEYGAAQRISPLATRIVARNPGRFTWTGTGTLVVGDGDVAVIDPGPDRDDHLEAIGRAIAGRRVGAVLVTHNHLDHSALARRLADQHGAPLYGCRGVATPNDGAVRLEAADDVDFAPDEALVDGMTIDGDGWRIRALHTPGHTSEHFCFALEEERTLFCGDHVMAWSTSIVTPPDGHMATYVANLRRVKAMRFHRLVPTHGPHIDEPEAFIDAYIAHRDQRRAAVLDLMERGASRIAQLVDALYAGLSPALRPAAALSVWAHLIQLAEEGLIVGEPGVNLNARYSLARAVAA